MALLLLAGCVAGASDDAVAQFIRIEEAQLVMGGVDRRVSLPHQLDIDEVSPMGQLVEFTMVVHLPSVPSETRPWGIYVPKMALAGSVSVNGHLDAACGRGRISELRCAQQPQLFVPPPSLWKLGANELTFKIYADRRQSNGLSAVYIGDAEALQLRLFRWQYLLQVDLVVGLAWLSIFLGMLALLVTLHPRQDAFYLWFGLASLSGGVSNVLFNVTHPPIGTHVFGQLVFASRFTSLILMVPMFLAVFGRLGSRARNITLAYLLTGLVLIAAYGNDRLVVIGLYGPLLVAWLIFPPVLTWWAWKNPRPMQIQLTLMSWILLCASVVDWSRLLGLSAFEGVYLIPYAYGGQMVIIGAVLIGLLARSLAQSRELSANLEARVIERTAELDAVHKQILAQEVERNKVLERERLLQDMHDGFGTQLASAKRMAERGHMTQQDMSRVLQECMSDLYLVVDTLSESGGTIRNAVADFRHRIQQRLVDTGVTVNWNVQLNGVPELSYRGVLQVLRIAQEALNNTLKHSGARSIWIDVVYHAEQQALEWRVKDDGTGLPQVVREGRGMNNMRGRARDIGAQLHFDSTAAPGSPGTTVRLWWPLAPFNNPPKNT